MSDPRDRSVPMEDAIRNAFHLPPSTDVDEALSSLARLPVNEKRCAIISSYIESLRTRVQELEQAELMREGYADPERDAENVQIAEQAVLIHSESCHLVPGDRSCALKDKPCGDCVALIAYLRSQDNLAKSLSRQIEGMKKNIHNAQQAFALALSAKDERIEEMYTAEDIEAGISGLKAAMTDVRAERDHLTSQVERLKSSLRCQSCTESAVKAFNEQQREVERLKREAFDRMVRHESESASLDEKIERLKALAEADDPEPPKAGLYSKVIHDAWLNRKKIRDAALSTTEEGQGE